MKSAGLTLLLVGLLVLSSVMPSHQERPGKCPTAPPGTVTPCIAHCETDESCPILTQKCCSWGCMRTCREPV
uniref:Porwaprin-a-like n=1 Tax=Pogona vitticeps TaxID=103695 RepID=A0ABM5G4W4_9SAUR